MKFIFRRELGEEHLFVLWQKADGAVLAISELLITAVWSLIGVAWLVFAVNSSTVTEVAWTKFGVLFSMFALFLWYNHRCQLQPWRRLD